MTFKSPAAVFAQDVHGCHVRCVAVATLLALPEPQESDDAAMRRVEAVAEAVAEAPTQDLRLAKKMRQAATRMPKQADITADEMRFVHQIEREVDCAFGEDCRLYGRAVALYVVREMQSR